MVLYGEEYLKETLAWEKKDFLLLEKLKDEIHDLINNQMHNLSLSCAELYSEVNRAIKDSLREINATEKRKILVAGRLARKKLHDDKDMIKEIKNLKQELEKTISAVDEILNDENIGFSFDYKAAEKLIQKQPS